MVLLEADARPPFPAQRSGDLPLCATDSTGLMILVNNCNFALFDVVKSEFLQHTETSRYEQRKHVVSYHALFFSRVKYSRGLQLHIAALFFHPPCTLSNNIVLS